MTQAWTKLKTFFDPPEKRLGPDLASPSETALAVWSLFLRSWRTLLAISALQLLNLAFMLPSQLYRFSHFDNLGRVIARPIPSTNVDVFLQLLWVAGGAAVTGFVFPALIALIYMRLIGKPFTVRQALSRARDIFWRHLLVFILVVMAISVCSWLPSLLGFAASMAVATYLMFSEHAVVLEDKPPVEAIKSSFHLVRGRFWAILWRMIIVGGIFSVATIALTMLTLKPIDWLDIYLMNVQRQKVYFVLFSALGMLVSVIVLPLFLAIMTAFYAELRKHLPKKE